MYVYDKERIIFELSKAHSERFMLHNSSCHSLEAYERKCELDEKIEELTGDLVEVLENE